MTDIPDAAIEAAAEVIHDSPETLVCALCRYKARAAIEAALPAIREHIAQEIEAIPYSPELEHGDNGEWMQVEAALVVRGGASDA